MTQQECASFERAVAEFFRREGLDSLSIGRLTCPSCGADGDRWRDSWFRTGACPVCGARREEWEGSRFSWWPCDVCGSRLGGNRSTCIGHNPTTHAVQGEFEVCDDCLYYVEYGRLDDQTVAAMR
jgi:hypothetical protein